MRATRPATSRSASRRWATRSCSSPTGGAARSFPFWTAFAGKANATVAPRLKQMLRQKADEADDADQLANKEAAVELVRCLRLEPCYPDLIAAATDERLGEALLFAAADIGAMLEPYLTSALSHAGQSGAQVCGAGRWRRCRSNRGRRP